MSNEGEQINNPLSPEGNFGVDPALPIEDLPISIEEKEKQIEEVKKLYQEYINRNRAYFQIFAKDTSINFVMGNGFSINFETGNVNFDTKWFVEHGFTEDQITWAVYHELCHFRDLAEDPNGLMKNFEYIRKQSVETGRILEQKYEDKFGQSDPEFLEKIKRRRPVDKKDPSKGTISKCEMTAYKYHHTFFNIFDDIYVNNLVAKKSPRYASGSRGGDEVSRLYREKLFTNTDYTKLPRHLQFLYKLLREEMVPTEVVQVSDEVQQALESKIIFQGKALTPKEIVDNFLKPISKKDTKAGTRYFILKTTLEPIFQKLLQKDLEEFDPQKPEENKGKPQKGDGEGGEGESEPNVDPFGDDYKDNLPDPLDEGTVPKWIKREKEKKEGEDKKKEAEAKSPEQKEREIQEAIDKKWCAENGVSESEFAEYLRVKNEVAPYLEELSELWRDIIYGKGRESWREMEGHYKTGTELDIAEVINQFPEIEKGNLDSVRVMNREVEKEVPVNRPDLIRVRLVADMSGSMSSEGKMTVLRQCFVLILSSLKEFDSFLNISRSETKTKMKVDTEAWTFGNEAERVKPFRADSGEFSDDTVDIIKILNTLTNPSDGSTLDNKALEAIADSLKPEDVRKIEEKKTMDIVLEITDGGSTDPDSAKISVDGLNKTGVITRAFQIGDTSEGDRQTFNSVWNDGREERMGEIVGSEIKNLLPALVKALKKYLGNVRL
jgi:hypothetical protein